jgi:hypothetical protein
MILMTQKYRVTSGTLLSIVRAREAVVAVVVMGPKLAVVP